MRAASIQHSNLTDFVIGNIVSFAQKVVDEDERFQLTARENAQLLDLLDDPPNQIKN
jgi:uncharacterized protein (DUF1778 family)